MEKNKWSKKSIYWESKKYNNYSFVFSWHLWEWLQTVQPELNNKPIKIGGPAVEINKTWVPDWILTGSKEKVLYRHNIQATRTSKGCIRKCKFCAVPNIEGSLKELDGWEVKPIVIDNNLLACSKKHFDKVIDKLKILSWCDFNQGLDARLLTKHHAERFAELKKPYIRLSWDHIKIENEFMKAFELIRKAGISKQNIRVYVLIGFNDTPEDALYRLETIKKLGLEANPMRYQSINCKKKNNYIDKRWTDRKLKDYMRYWSNQRYFGSIPFKEYMYTK